ATGQAGHWWLHRSLNKLEKSYKDELQIQLIIQKGDAGSILAKLIKKYKITQVVWNRLYSPNSIERDSNLKKSFKDQGIEVETFNGHLLNEPWEVQNNSGQSFLVFIP
ncbi:MAG: deoxyribodipyrimidine photo-lyase, partial [Pelagibacteraceae bacterium]